MDSKLSFGKITSFERGILARLLRDAYSFDQRWDKLYGSSFDEFDDYFYDNPTIANRCGFITLYDSEPIGHISWDPRGLPDFVRIGHNCIAAAYKGRGFGKLQLQEAIRRITASDAPMKIVVTTSGSLIAARHNYESVGFKLMAIRENREDYFTGDYYDYEYVSGC